MADYTYAPAPVLIEATGEFAIGVTGALKTADGTTVVQAYDLNNSPIGGILVGPKGAHGAFKADIPYGVLDFGSVLLPTTSIEQQNAGLTALATAAAAAADAADALDVANAASSNVADTVSGKSNRYLTIKDISANYQIIASDAEDILLRSTAAGPITITFPSEATESIRIGAAGTILVDAAGQVTFQQGSGATLASRESFFKSVGQGAFISWVKLSTNGFRITGELSAT
jgi:hypothetical protein